MDIEKQIIQGNGFNIPSIIVTPSSAAETVIIVHSYGGCKEEVLGLAWRIAQTGIRACVIDLRGHGENELPLDEKVALDVETTINYFQRFGRTAIIGHSLGGRLALLSSADYVIGISPAFSKNFSSQTQETLMSLRGYRVKELREHVLFETLRLLPEWQPSDSKRVEIIFGMRDIPEIMAVCSTLKEKGTAVTQINHALHSDIIFLEETFQRVTDKLKEWFY